MTLQMESGAPACPECHGRGEVVMGAVCDCGCNGRLCGYETARCPECEGSRVDSCDHCGEPATRTDELTDQPVCPNCHAHQDEPRGSHPMGGMGRQTDYSEALAEGRALKD